MYINKYTPKQFTDHNTVIDAAFMNGFQQQLKNITDCLLNRKNTVLLFEGTGGGEYVPTTRGSIVNLSCQGILQRTTFPTAGDIVLDVNTGYLGVVSSDPQEWDPQDFDCTGLGLKLNISA